MNLYSFFDLGWLIVDAVYCQVLRYTYRFLPVRKFSGIKKRTIVFDKLTFKVRPRSSDSIILLQILLFKIYPLGKWNFQKKAILIDIGAHIGVFSVYAAHLYDQSKVYAFEPSSSNYKLLLENIKLNRLENRIFPFCLAVGGKKARRSLSLDELFPSANSFGQVISYSQDSEMVDCTTLEEILTKNNIGKCDLLKLDCEGSEFEIITMTSSDVLKKIRAMILEFHLGQEKQTIFCNYLKQNGFSVKVFPALHENFTILAKR